MSASPSYAARWSIEDGAAPSFDSSSERWDFSNDTVKASTPLLATNGLRGTRSQIVANTRLGPYTVGGALTIAPSPAFLSAWLIRAMGGGTATAPAFADAIPEFGMIADRSGAVLKYLGLKVNQLKLTGRAGGLLECTVDVLGKSETAGVSFAGAALGTSLAYEPFQAADMVFTAASSTRTVIDWDLTINNNLRARGANSLTADYIIEGRRSVTFNATVPLTSGEYADLQTNYGKDGAAATLVLTNSTVSTSFSFGRLQIPPQSPNLSGDEFLLQLSGEVRAATSGAEFTVACDITP